MVAGDGTLDSLSLLEHVGGVAIQTVCCTKNRVAEWGTAAGVPESVLSKRLLSSYPLLPFGRAQCNAKKSRNVECRTSNGSIEVFNREAVESRQSYQC